MIKKFLFKSSLFRSLYCYLRFIYFIYVKKNYKFLNYDKKSNLTEIDLLTLGYDESSIISPDDYFQKIYEYEKKSLIKQASNFKNFKKIFSGNRSSLIINPILSCSFIDRAKVKILSIGPRTESEILVLIGNGFHKKNIKSVDLQSYSPLIDVGDLHNLDFEDSQFDIVICGWTLAYSYNKQKAASEIIRVSKNNSIISVSGTYAFNEKGSITAEKLINRFEQNIKKIIFNLDYLDFPSDYSRKHSILTFISKKN